MGANSISTINYIKIKNSLIPRLITIWSTNKKIELAVFKCVD